jgi:hypothetical protein
MATRLYPLTTNSAVLEQLTGVPAGTAARQAQYMRRVRRADIGSSAQH